MLRPYQQAAIDSARAAVQAGHRRVLLVGVTGCGKTSILAAIADACIDRGGSVDWFVPRAEILDQSRARCPRANVMTYQAAIRRALGNPTIQAFDECHHAPSDSWRRVANPRALHVGATATPERGDGTGLGTMYDVIVPIISAREATEQGFLVPCEVIAPERQLRPGELAQHPWAAYLAYCPGERCIVFSQSVDVAEEHAAQFRNAGIAAECIHGESKDRAEILDRFRAGTTRVLTNCALLGEGVDIPEVDAVILARGFGTAGSYLQAVGRALRLAAGKTRALVIDLRGSSIAHGHPTRDRVYSLEGKGIRIAEPSDGESFCAICGALKGEAAECMECGATNERAFPRVVDVPLRVYARDALKGDDDEMKVQRLRKWISEARARGHKWQSALFKFKGVYQRPATAEEIRRAS